MALSIYLRANVPDKVVACFVQRGEFDQVRCYYHIVLHYMTNQSFLAPHRVFAAYKATKTPSINTASSVRIARLSNTWLLPCTGGSHSVCLHFVCTAAAAAVCVCSQMTSQTGCSIQLKGWLQVRLCTDA